MGLDEQAAEAVSRWRFEPATLDGKPVGVDLNIEVTFRLYRKDQASAASTSSAASQGVPAAGSGSQAEQYFRDGTVAFSAQHYADAATSWKHAVQLDPQHPEAWNGLCRADFELKLMSDAVEACQKQLAIAPEHKYAHNNLARALWAQGKLAEAEQEFRKQIEVDPHNRWAHANLGLLLAREGKCGDAIPELESEHRVDPSNQKASDALRQCYVQTGQSEKAATLPVYVPNSNMGGVIGGIISSTPVAVPKVATPVRVRVSSGVEASNLINKVQPVYPLVAKNARIQGDVVLQAVINTEGTVESLEAVSGHPLLIPAALDAVKQWRYKPYHLNGGPVPVETTIQVNFTLGK